LFNVSCTATFLFGLRGKLFYLFEILGGTLDITAHEILPKNSVKQIYRASGEGLGGTTVDKAFNQLLIDFFGSNILQKCKEQSMSEYICLLRQFELKKRAFNPEAKDDIIIGLPLIILELFDERVSKEFPSQNISSSAKEMISESRSRYIESTDFCDLIKVKKDKMHINAELFKQLFENTLKGIIKHIRNVLTNIRKKIPIIVLVGGFSESNMIQEKIRKTFPKKIIISPPEASLAVLKGAVLFGHNPCVIKSRIMKYTYGVECSKYPFVKGKHPEKLKKWVNGHWSCSKCFDPFVSADEEISVGNTVTKIYNLNGEDAKDGVNIYSSSSTPKYIAECERIGSILLEYPEGGWSTGTKLIVNMKFGGTEFTVSVTDTSLNKTYKNAYNFLKA